MYTLVERAFLFAKHAHEGQTRKYTGEPYFNHAYAVAVLVFPHGPTVTAAALLHDVVEDTEYTLEDIETEFGVFIASIVEQLTDCETGNRKERKAAACERLRNAGNFAKTIKLADMIDNRKSIMQYDKDFAVVYMREARELLPNLKGGCPKLYKQLEDILDEYYERVSE